MSLLKLSIRDDTRARESGAPTDRINSSIPYYYRRKFADPLIKGDNHLANMGEIPILRRFTGIENFVKSVRIALTILPRGCSSQFLHMGAGSQSETDMMAKGPNIRACIT